MSSNSFLYFVKNKHYFLKETTFISHSVFYGLTNGSITTSSPIKTRLYFCVFEEIIKEGNGACIETVNNEFVTISKCVAKCCGVYAENVTTASGHFFHLNTDTKDKSVTINDVSLSSCSSSIHSDQRSIIRVSKTDSDCSDINITNSYSHSHPILLRQLGTTKLKRIKLNRIVTTTNLFYIEYGSITGEKIDVSNISIGNEEIFFLYHNTLTFSDCALDVNSSRIICIESTAIFEKCYFPQKIPSTNGVQIRNSVSSFYFGEPIIKGWEIYQELDEKIRGKKVNSGFIKSILINILFCYCILYFLDFL